MDTTNTIAPVIHCGGIDAVMRQRWERFTEQRINDWLLSTHEPWLSTNKSRVVLLQATFMLNFIYETGDAAGRLRATESAIAFAKQGPVERKQVGHYRYWIIPGAVAFTAILGSAGWVLGDDAATFANLVRDEDEAALTRLLRECGGFTPSDHTAGISAGLRRMQHEELMRKVREATR